MVGGLFKLAGFVAKLSYLAAIVHDVKLLLGEKP